MRTEIKETKCRNCEQKQSYDKRFSYEFLTFKPKVIIQANRNKE